MIYRLYSLKKKKNISFNDLPFIKICKKGYLNVYTFTKTISFYLWGGSVHIHSKSSFFTKFYKSTEHKCKLTKKYRNVLLDIETYLFFLVGESLITP